MPEEKIDHEITEVLLEWTAGDETALARLMPLVMDDLRKTARGYMRKERKDHTLQPTALVNELYLRLTGRRTVQWKNREHFFGFAANLMRRILVDHARIRTAKKRNDGIKPLSLNELLDSPENRDVQLLLLDEALDELAKLHPRQFNVVIFVHFFGLTHKEAAEILGVSPETVKRDWRAAKLWIVRYFDDQVEAKDEQVAV